MSKHTKGPWEYVRDFDYWKIEPTDIGGKDNYEGNEADYLLIAAAPELLAACEEFVRKVDCGEARSVRSYAQMKEAIKKANGGEL